MIANNKKAYHDYFILEKYEAGIVLHGTEVKSLRMGQCSIKEAFIRIENGEMFIYGMHVSPYEKGNIFNKDPLRPRKLLLHKKEIDKIFGKMKEKGNTVVPLQVYFNGSLVKVEVGLAKGKKLYDKRDDIAKKTRKEKRRENLKSEICKHDDCACIGGDWCEQSRNMPLGGSYFSSPMACLISERFSPVKTIPFIPSF